MRMGNPSLRRTLRRAEAGKLAVETRAATYGGIAWKSVVFCLLTIVTAVATSAMFQYAIRTENDKLALILMIVAGVCTIPMLICSLIISFVPSTVRVLGFVYSLSQGFLLGLMVYAVELIYPGVSLAAVLGTLIVFVVTFLLNKVLSVKVSNRFVRILCIAFFSLMIVEIVWAIVCALSGIGYGVLFWIQLGVTAFAVFYASAMLMWDLQCAEEIVNVGADQKYEWNVAFCLVTTLVYLYIEILELIVRLAALFGKRK